MNRFKNIIIFFLLVLLTLSVVLTPALLETANAENRINEKEFWEYKSTSSAVTQRQVADMVWNSQITAGAHTEYQESDSAEYRESINSMLDEVFGNNSDICGYFKTMAAENEVHFSRERILVTVNSSPVALNFFNCTVYGEEDTFDVFYEEKTKTLVNFSYYCNLEPFETPEFNPDDMMLICENYYGSMGLPEERYEFECRWEDDYLSVFFGLSVKCDDIIEEEDIIN